MTTQTTQQDILELSLINDETAWLAYADLMEEKGNTDIANEIRSLMGGNESGYSDGNGYGYGYGYGDGYGHN